MDQLKNTFKQYLFGLGSDGSFRVEDVEPGDYELDVSVNPWLAGKGVTGWNGQLHYEFTVLEIPDGRTDEPLDLTIKTMNHVMDEMEAILAKRPATGR